jgi:hypothetical protein
MPIPRLLHPVKIYIRQMNLIDTIQDPRAREPVRITYKDGEFNLGSEIIIKGQISFAFSGAKLDKVRHIRQGSAEESIGYFSCRFKDLITADLVDENADGSYDIKLKNGDKIVRLGKRNVNYYIIGFEDFAHYPDLGQTMLEVDFSDRRPSE